MCCCNHYTKLTKICVLNKNSLIIFIVLCDKDYAVLLGTTCVSPFILYQDKLTLWLSLSLGEFLDLIHRLLAFSGSCHGVWIPGGHRFGRCCFLCSENKREDLALWKTKYLLAGASCWWENLRRQRRRGVGEKRSCLTITV